MSVIRNQERTTRAVLLPWALLAVIGRYAERIWLGGNTVK